MGSHNVTCHLTQANTPRLNHWYSIYRPRGRGVGGRRSWPRWHDYIPAGNQTREDAGYEDKHKRMFKKHGVCTMLSLTLFKIIISIQSWPSGSWECISSHFWDNGPQHIGVMNLTLQGHINHMTIQLAISQLLLVFHWNRVSKERHTMQMMLNSAPGVGQTMTGLSAKMLQHNNTNM